MASIFNAKKELPKEQANIWVRVKYGIFTFCLIHLIFEIAIQNHTNIVWAVVFNYIISGWFALKIITKDKLTGNPYFLGLLISFGVFLIRVIIGILYTMLLS